MPRLRDLSFDLPPRFVDTTPYFFTSSAGPILKLPLSLLPLAAKDVDAWLAKARDDLAIFPKARRGPLKTYENPRYLVRGFETDFGASSVVVALLVFEGCALLLQPKCRPDADTQLRYVFRSFERDAGVEPSVEPGAFRHRALGFRFDSLQPLERPPYLTLRGPDQLKISGKASERPIKLQSPDWSPSFGLSFDTILTEVLQGRQVLVGHASSQEPKPPQFRMRFWLASAETNGEVRQLTYADAICRGGDDHFRFELRGEGPGMEQLDLWSAFLTSARWS